MRKLAFPLLTILLVLLAVKPVQAHAADMYFHTLTVNMTAEKLEVIWELAPGPMLAQAIWQNADLDEDDRVSRSEGDAWAASILPQIVVACDQTPLQLELQGSEWPLRVDSLYSSEGAISILLHADWPAAPLYDTTFSFHNRFEEPYSVNWFVIQGGEEMVFTLPKQQNGMLDFQLFAAQESLNLPAEEYFKSWESARPTIPGSSVPSETPTQSNTLSVLQDMLRTEQFSVPFLLSSFGVSLLLGALHALSPGHGKTVVAAYLVGSQGKLYHAIVLGLLVTLTHTGSVFAVGLLTLTASKFFLPTAVFEVLELASGALILVLGVALLIPRIREWIAFNRYEQEKKSRKPSETTPAAPGQSRLVLNAPIEEYGPAHSHDESMIGYIPRGLPQGKPLSGITWRSLIPLGISGGMVPCPDAIAILLIAVTINRIAFGLSLIVTFSLGLAVVLIIIGLLMLQGKRLFERLQWFNRIAYIMPLVSALFVAGLGAALTVGALSKGEGGIRIPRLAASAPSFDYQQARVLYLAPDEQDNYQVFSIPVAGGEADMLTQAPYGVLDYSLSPDRTALVYTRIEGVSTTQLWKLELATRERSLILDCPQADCSSVIWQPDSLTILHSRLDYAAGAAALGYPTIHWLDLETLESGAIFQDASIPAYNPRLSKDGRYLSYTSINPRRIQIYELRTGENRSIEIQTGSPAIWSTADNAFLFTNIVQVGDAYLTRLFRYDLKQEQILRLGGEDYYNDNFPDWSSDDEWIALVRSAQVIEDTYRGDQIWLMRADGSDLHPITKEVDLLHQKPVWSPDGAYLLYTVYSINTGGDRAPPVVRVLEVESGQVTEIVAGGTNPIWLP